MKTFLISVACTVILGVIGCKKKSGGGLGGNASLKVSVFHHTTAIDSCTVYIKFNSSEAPSSEQYDLNQEIETDSSGNSYTIFNGLKKGDYYIFAKGWDPTISENVKGGIPYTIGSEADLSTTIPVTETH